MSGRAAVAVVVALSLAVVGPVRASEPAPPGAYDTVVLRDGTVLRGTVREQVPGKAVVIAVGEGDVRTLAWDEVASTSLVGQPGPEGPVQADMAQQSGPVGPRLFIETTRPGDVDLYEIDLAPAAYGQRPQALRRLVCRAPCGQVVDAGRGQPFSFGGEELTPSGQFYLKDLEGDWVARVKPGRRKLALGGFAALALGAMSAGGGGMTLLITRREESRIAGGMLLGAGIALIVAGVAMMVRGVTRYTLRRRG